MKIYPRPNQLHSPREHFLTAWAPRRRKVNASTHACGPGMATIRTPECGFLDSLVHIREHYNYDNHCNDGTTIKVQVETKYE